MQSCWTSWGDKDVEISRRFVYNAKSALREFDSRKKKTMQTLILAVLISFVVAIGAGHFLIPALRRMKAGQYEREDGPQSHLSKAGTPTMGGVFITLGVVAAALAFMGRVSTYMWFALIGAVAYGLIGLIDDLIIVLKKRNLGLKPMQKIAAQFIFAVLIALYAYRDPAIGPALYLPFSHGTWDLGIFYIPFTVFVIMSLTNCVNLTDGLDGLAGGVTLVNAAAYVIIFFSMGTAAIWAEDMLIFSAALMGAILGFLRYNSYPARVFMGDTGAFFLGGALSMLAIISRMQLLIPMMGIMFVCSGLSCILQVGSYKLRNKKRIFKMAPLHHHFELSGVHETKIVSVYMIITAVVCLLALLALGI